MKCRCGRETESWQRVKLYKMNALIEDVVVCPACVFLNAFIHLKKLKKADKDAYYEIEKHAQEIFDKEQI